MSIRHPKTGEEFVIVREEPDSDHENDIVLERQLTRKKTERQAFADRIIAKGEPWTDPDFPPETSSLYNTEIDVLLTADKKAEFTHEDIATLLRDGIANQAVQASSERQRLIN